MTDPLARAAPYEEVYPNGHHPPVDLVDNDEKVAGGLAPSHPDDFRWPGFDLEFWKERPAFEHVRRAAIERMVCPEAVFLETLGAVSALTPPQVVSESIVGPGSLNLMIGRVGQSGAGKSMALPVAHTLIPVSGAEGVHVLPPGSGEGMTAAYFDEQKDPDDRRKNVAVRAYRSVVFPLDEGQALAELGNRTGQTTMPTLRSMWSGQLVGGAFKSSRGVQLQPHSYRSVVTLALQPEHVQRILADAAGGTPQRFLWCRAADGDPEYPTGAPVRPLEWTPPFGPGDVGDDLIEVRFPPDIADEMRRARFEQQKRAGRSISVVSDLDGHRNLNRAKVAVLLALLDERTAADHDDWRLAGHVMDVSDRVRGCVVDYLHLLALHNQAKQNEASNARRHAAQDADEARTDARIKTCAENIARKVHAKGGRHTLSDCKKYLRGQDRSTYGDLAVEDAVDGGWLAHRQGAYWPGPSKPSDR